MGQSVSAVEACQKLGEILNRVSLRREEIIIKRAGKKIARLLPIENEARRSMGKLDFRKAAGLGKEIWKDIDIADYVVEMRAKYHFKTPDAIQLGTAVACGADYIITNDKAWQKLEEVKVLLIRDL
jgi:antitoxin (DNA-binding transcriptional repressor) of toxin-antitoxin stability system